MEIAVSAEFEESWDSGHCVPSWQFPGLAEAKDLIELNQVIRNCVQRFGFTDYFFVSGLDSKRPSFVSSVSEELTGRYFSDKMYQHDMLLSHAASQSGPVFSSALYKYLLNAPVDAASLKQQMQIHHLFRSHGFYDAYVAPMTSPEFGGPAVMFYLSRLSNPHDLACSVKSPEVMMLALTEIISVVFETYHAQETADSVAPRLTARQLNVLNTLATTDLTIGDMATSLDISVVTANKHLDAIRRAFDVKTNHAAILKAIAAGLVEPPYQ